MKITRLYPAALLAFLAPLVTPAAEVEPIHVVAQTLETGHTLLAQENYREAFHIYAGPLGWIPYAMLQLSWEQGQIEAYHKQSKTVEKIIQGLGTCLAHLDPPPAIPSDADLHAQKGAAFAKYAKDERDFLAAIKEFEQALTSALWVSDYHYNLALCQKSAKQFEPALLSLHFASILAHDDVQRHDINGLRAEIEVLQEIAKRP